MRMWFWMRMWFRMRFRYSYSDDCDFLRCDAGCGCMRDLVDCLGLFLVGVSLGIEAWVERVRGNESCRFRHGWDSVGN